MAKRDLYEVLGVAKTASADEIRKAYRASALKNHPDRNQGDKDAEARFKEATDAYQVLSDDEKRARYDHVGFAGLEGAPPPGNDFFSNFQDVFADFFGTNPAAQRNRPARGSDLHLPHQITLKEAFTGCRHDISFNAPADCGTCSGSGAKPGTERKQCVSCHGAGQVSTARGFMMFSQTCTQCRGEGSKVDSPCEDCQGVGKVEKTHKISVVFPAGVSTGNTLRVSGKGLQGRLGGPPGDLIVSVSIPKDATFARDGVDLIVTTRLSISQAALGTERTVRLPDDSEVVIDIPAGAQSGDVIITPAHGMPILNGKGRGNLRAVVEVRTPENLSERARELLVALEAELLQGVDA